ncbi:hypothetical protein [Nitrosomonas communis]|uniref:hypothetical protein n=1 Tax=Nitrosomonas communis TaxID=44574 RepID=UPI003D270D46
MIHTVDKIEAAVHQLDWAIRLLIDHDAPIPAITLAGAAEEILGGSLSGSLESAHKILKHNLSSEYQINGTTVSDQHLNKARNWLKHNDPASEKTLDLDLLHQPLQLILRGIYNLYEYDQSRLSQGHRFLAWAVNQNLDASEIDVIKQLQKLY